LGLDDRTAFGAGLSSVFPAGGARFLSDVDLAGHVFNTYDEGGFLTFAIGPRYPDYVDGRALPFGPELLRHSEELARVGPQSPEWQVETARYGISVLILPLSRYNVLEFFPALPEYCRNETWLPVYLDENSAVFVLRATATAGLLQRSIDCATVPIPARPPVGTGRNAFDEWVNASAVLRSLGREKEALAANRKALDLFPTSAYARWNQAILLEDAGDFSGAEEQYRLAAEYDPLSPMIWADLADAYERQAKWQDAVATWERVVSLSAQPWKGLLPLGYSYLYAHRPQDARLTFERLLANLPADPGSVLPGPVLARVARGRAAAACGQGDSDAAKSFEEQSMQMDGGSAQDWKELSHLYSSYGCINEAQRAEKRASALSSPRTE
jgi:tetratricopeptide (TPR) repeat protein